MVTAAQRALDDSRGAIAALVRPPIEPLPEALIRVAEEVAHRWGATVEAHVEPGVDLAAPAREALLRIVGEAVTNAARHGRAQRIRLELTESPEMRLRIVDDGAGFDPGTLEVGTRRGIAGMRERVEALGGQLRLRSQPGQGTEIVVELP
jgi:signal transduction histidine kinase